MRSDLVDVEWRINQATASIDGAEAYIMDPRRFARAENLRLACWRVLTGEALLVGGSGAQGGAGGDLGAAGEEEGAEA